MVNYQVSGTEKFREAAVRLRIAERTLPERMRKAVDQGARPLPAAARRSALENLPHHNELNLVVARARITIRRVSPTMLEVRAKGIEQLGNTNAGRVNHPTYGHRPRRTQRIPRAKGWFNKPMRKAKPRVKKELGDAMHKVAKDIT